MLFGLSIYVFRRKYTPGKLYMATTFLFFVLATVSIVLDTVSRCMFTLNFINLAYAVPFSATLYPLQTASEWIFFVAGSLADIMLIYRCYRLWNSRKRYIILPMLGLLATVVSLIVVEYQKARSSNLFQSINGELGLSEISSILNIYVIITFVQNLLLTGLIAGRIWWLDRKMQKMLQLVSQPRNHFQSLLRTHVCHVS
ncbi:hypothetical protein BT96DRAFT_443552 [Gymnopus androsaceus JB14]|uniref:Uncharacterized protein n=1 Tax=Gymnopus androsaceus JB14 TaxID=1447944 RepID=A0A6A4GRQ7_9AGAR|nr:hypothetical protein BT96DRAFT_443552 [Gymnopus androsaceus JB14]